MDATQKDYDNDCATSDIVRRRGQSRFQVLTAILLVLVTLSSMLITQPYEAAAVEAGTTQTADAHSSATPDNLSLTVTSEEEAATEVPPDDAKAFEYNSNIPLESDIQEYLYDLCEQRNLDYKMCLAIIKEESNFKAKALGGGSNYGLFQINKCNHKMLSSTLNTANKPFDPETNINWGTYLLSYLYEKYADTYNDDDLLKAVLSAYNRGEGGFKKYGFAKSYIKGYYKALEVVNSWFE